MRFLSVILASLLLLLSCTGCGAIQRTAAVPETGVPALDSLNQVLKDRKATLTFTDGSEKRVENVRLGLEETRYEVRPTGRKQRILTDEIARITIIEKAGEGRNYVGLVTAVPGLVITGLGTLTWITADDSGYGSLIGPLVVLAGIGITAVGALLGSVIGDALLPKNRSEETVVYEGPVQRYLSDEMPP